MTTEAHVARGGGWRRMFALASVGLALVSVSPGAVAQDDYETPQNLDAAEFLDAGQLVGPYHTVLRSVDNDGYMNTYRLSTPFGEVVAPSTADVASRIHEIQAMAAMEEVKKSDAFKSAAKVTASGAVEGAKNLVTRPVDTVRGAVSGVGHFFQRAAQATRTEERSDAEDSGYMALLGVSQAKRAVAAGFGVDVYSPNDLLQAQLEELARVQYAGGLVIKAPLALTGGTVGSLVSTTQAMTTLNQLVAATPPEELRIRNREKLLAMGVDGDLLDLFLQTSTFTPRQQTLLVEALDQMPATGNRRAFVKFAVGTESEELAAFRERIATMFESYNRTVQPITNFVQLNRFIAGQAKDKTVVMIVPVDYLLWTRSTADIVRALDAQIQALDGAEGKQIWVDGLSPRAKRELEARKWQVFDNAPMELLSTNQ